METLTNLSEMLFPVEKVEITDFECNSDYSHDIYVYPQTGVKRRVNSCSNRYELILNADIFPQIEEILDDSGVQYQKTYRMADFSRFYVTYRITDKRFQYHIKGSQNDIIEPKIDVMHSYNGMVQYTIVFGYYRLVCSNGMVIPVEEMKEYNLMIKGKHTAQIKKSFDQLQNKLEYFVNNAAQITLAITAKYDMLAGKSITNVDDRIKEVLNVLNLNERTLKSGEKSFPQFDIVKEAIDKEVKLYKGKVNDWLIYNGVNQLIFSDEYKTAYEKRQEKDSKVLEFMTN